MGLKKVGDNIVVKADEILGTPQTDAKIIGVYPWGYTVICADDPEKWEGPISLNGDVISGPG